MIESTVGRQRGRERPVPREATVRVGGQRPRRIGFVVAAAFRTPSPLGFGLVHRHVRGGVHRRKFWATTLHAELDPRGKEVGEHEWVSLTPPCCLKNATGMETSFALAFAASRVIEPKYC